LWNWDADSFVDETFFISASQSIRFQFQLPVKTSLSAPNPESTGRAVARATAGIGVFNAMRLVVGFVSTTLIANNLGLSKQADIFNVAIDIVSSLWLGFEKTVNAAVLPLFGRSLKEDGEESAWRFGSSVLAITVLLVMIVAPLAWWLMPTIVDLYSQKSGAAQRALTVELARLGLAGLGFLAVSSLTYVFLNAYKRFAAAALGDLAWKLGILLAAVYALVTKAPLDRVLPILTYGLSSASFLKLAPQVWALRGSLKHLTAKVDWRDPRLKAAFWLSIPLLMASSPAKAAMFFVTGSPTVR
jgi:putative peptidoglycan lipid II flippase